MRQDPPNQKGKCPREAVPSAESAHVLLVEDDGVMREMLAEALRREGCRVTECADAVRWIEFCMSEATTTGAETSDERYDVVVSDIRMPRVNGLDVLRIVRQVGHGNSCPPTILITAFGDEETHRKASELGAVAVLDKPFPIKQLTDKVLALAARQANAERPWREDLRG